MAVFHFIWITHLHLVYWIQCRFQASVALNHKSKLPVDSAAQYAV